MSRADVAKGALRVLARAATGLPTQQVVRLLLEMARAGMGQELNALAAVLSAPGVRKAPEVVALAAAVAPDEALCQQTLQQAGLVALAACFTYNWCVSDVRGVIRGFRAQQGNAILGHHGGFEHSDDQSASPIRIFICRGSVENVSAFSCCVLQSLMQCLLRQAVRQRSAGPAGVDQAASQIRKCLRREPNHSAPTSKRRVLRLLQTEGGGTDWNSEQSSLAFVAPS